MVCDTPGGVGGAVQAGFLSVRNPSSTRHTLWFFQERSVSDLPFSMLATKIPSSWKLKFFRILQYPKILALRSWKLLWFDGFMCGIHGDSARQEGGDFSIRFFVVNFSWHALLLIQAKDFDAAAETILANAIVAKGPGQRGKMTIARWKNEERRGRRWDCETFRNMKVEKHGETTWGSPQSILNFFHRVLLCFDFLSDIFSKVWELWLWEF